MTFSVFKNINQFAGRYKFLDILAIFCAKYLLYLLVLFLIIFALIVNKWEVFLYPLFSGLFGVFVIDKIIYFFYKKRRPAELPTSKVLIRVPRNPSFPSRHASISFGISFFLLFYNIPLALIFLVCSFLVSIARVFCGVHWFRDVLAGALVGLISSLVIYRLSLIEIFR